MRYTSLLVLVTTLVLGSASAQSPQASDEVEPQPFEEDEDFGALELEELMQIRVTSVAGRPEPLLDMPAAIFVVTDEDVRRTGSRSIAESLRMVPGVTVARITPSAWAVSVRGFTDRFANKLLVLIDGRTVYDPLFSGVFWHVQDVLMEDLDRIEVIRGPGATLWGANAVNGVINVVTKTAKESQGIYATGGGGNFEQGFAAFRYGDHTEDENVFYRVYGKYDNYGSYDNILGGEEPNSWDMFRGGFRVDVEGDDDLDATVQGDIYGTGHIGERVRVPVPDAHLMFTTADLDQRYRGGNLVARIGQTRSPDERWQIQTYYDRTETRGGQPGFEVSRDTFDVDYRHYVPLGEGDDGANVLMWGLGYRHTRDTTTSSPTLFFSPTSRSLDTVSGFIQDTATLIPDKLVLMVGSKFEHNDFTGFEFQPSGRLSWMPDENQTVWGAISRAVRTPSRSADDITFTTAIADTGLLAGGAASGIFVPLNLVGDPNVESEDLIAYELGYRVRATDDLTFDLATFYNDYDNLITFPSPGAASFGNRGEAEAYGVELASTWEISDNWVAMASYSFLDLAVTSVDGNDADGKTPRHMFDVRSYLDVTDDLEFNSALYFVDTIPKEGASSYFRLDLGLTWRPAPNLELSIWGQNLLDDKHLEFGDDQFQALPLEVERSFYAQLTLRF